MASRLPGPVVVCPGLCLVVLQHLCAATLASTPYTHLKGYNDKAEHTVVSQASVLILLLRQWANEHLRDFEKEGSQGGGGGDKTE